MQAAGMRHTQQLTPPKCSHSNPFLLLHKELQGWRSAAPSTRSCGSLVGTTSLEPAVRLWILPCQAASPYSRSSTLRCLWRLRWMNKLLPLNLFTQSPSGCIQDLWKHTSEPCVPASGDAEGGLSPARCPRSPSTCSSPFSLRPTQQFHGASR